MEFGAVVLVRLLASKTSTLCIIQEAYTEFQIYRFHSGLVNRGLDSCEANTEIEVLQVKAAALHVLIRLIQLGTSCSYNKKRNPDINVAEERGRFLQ